MPIVALKCPNCNGNLEINDRVEFGFCPYCGTKVIVKEESFTNGDSSQLQSDFQMMMNYYNNHNIENAYIYSVKVLDIDSSQSQAWYIRGKCTSDITEKRYSFENVLKS